jgi:cytidylate kinase
MTFTPRISPTITARIRSAPTMRAKRVVCEGRDLGELDI